MQTPTSAGRSARRRDGRSRDPKSRPLPDEADAEARQVEPAGSSVPGCSAVSPPSSAQPARRHPSATPGDDRGDLLGHDLRDRQVVQEEERLAPVQTTSFADMATRSMPTVSSRPARRATSSFVPTPSVAAARTRPSPRSKSPANPPTPRDHLGRDAAVGDMADQRRPRGPLPRDRRRRSGTRAEPASCARGHSVSSTNFDGSSSPDRDRILAVEARPAEACLRRPRSPRPGPPAKVGQRVRADERADRLHAVIPAAMSSSRVDMSIP